MAKQIIYVMKHTGASTTVSRQLIPKHDHYKSQDELESSLKREGSQDVITREWITKLLRGEQPICLLLNRFSFVIPFREC